MATIYQAVTRSKRTEALKDLRLAFVSRSTVYCMAWSVKFVGAHVPTSLPVGMPLYIPMNRRLARSVHVILNGVSPVQTDRREGSNPTDSLKIDQGRCVQYRKTYTFNTNVTMSY